MITNFGLSGTALLWTVSGTVPSHIGIGAGSQAVIITTEDLVTPILTRRAFETTDFTVGKQITWDATWGPVELSGLTVTELGLYSHASTGSVWAAEGFIGVDFDGTNELKVEATLRTGSL